MKPFPISATISRCHSGQALVILDSPPFNGLEIRPTDLLHLAERLKALAEVANRLPTSGKHYRPTKMQMSFEKTARAIDSEKVSRLFNQIFEGKS